MAWTTFHECRWCGSLCEDSAPCCSHCGRRAGMHASGRKRLRYLVLPLFVSATILFTVAWLALRDQKPPSSAGDLSGTPVLSFENGEVVFRNPETHERLSVCPHCGGKGRENARHSGSGVCSVCGGSGFIPDSLLRHAGGAEQPWRQPGR